MNPTLCPKCAGRLEQIVCSGIEVDRCLYCKGMWFDSLEAEQLKAVKGSESLDIGNPETGTQLDRTTEDVDCPRCYARMAPMVDIDQHCIWYEKCPACHGVWLDAGEFKKFKDNFKRQGLLKQAMKVFRLKR
ncbi:MAG: zf-TFIIB domain-containing protein [Coleofasciculus sp. Co-bin14]|nr:zf-TFIIB domain-containing protein [Coleofasciculus sp. Co-bin14]